MKTQFDTWLTRKKMTTEEFAAKSGVSYNTAAKWRSLGRKPRRFYRGQLHSKFPDCPIFA